MGLNGPPGRQVYITSRAFSSRHLRRKSSLAASCPPCHCMPSLSSLAACVCLLIMISSSAFPCPPSLPTLSPPRVYHHTGQCPA